jgi:glutathione peroxidase-family protein
LATTINDFEALGSDGNPVKLSKYKGNVILIDNAAGAYTFTP